MRQNSIAIKKSLSTPVLMMGTERPLLILNVTFSAIFLLSTRMHWMAFFTPVIFIFLHLLCVKISKADPFMMRKFKQSTRFRGFYPARGGKNSRFERKFSSQVGGARYV